MALGDRERRCCGARPRTAASEEVDDGRKSMYKIFVESKIITAGDFDLCWRNVDLTRRRRMWWSRSSRRLHEKGIFLIDKSLRLLSDKSRVAYLPLDRYDVDMDLARGFPAESAGAGACCRSTG